MHVYAYVSVCVCVRVYVCVPQSNRRNHRAHTRRDTELEANGRGSKTRTLSAALNLVAIIVETIVHSARVARSRSIALARNQILNLEATGQGDEFGLGISAASIDATCRPDRLLFALLPRWMLVAHIVLDLVRHRARKARGAICNNEFE